MTTNAHSSAGAHGQTPEWLLPDPRWEEQKARLWAMTPDERVRAMHAGELSMRLCLHWASRRPSEVPLVNGEFAFVATRPRSPMTAGSASSSPSRSFAARPAQDAASTARAAVEASHHTSVSGAL
jgi:hypothetical protein